MIDRIEEICRWKRISAVKCITLADDGHYYLDVRAGKSAAFRAHSRHGDLDAALGRARAVLALEPAA